MLVFAVVGTLFAMHWAQGGNWVLATALALAVIGVGANTLVIAVNGGRMPAQTDEIPSSHENDYKIMGRATRMAFLGDWISIGNWLISPGDVCVYTGLAVYVTARFLGLIIRTT
jgi:hypothetical protein